MTKRIDRQVCELSGEFVGTAFNEVEVPFAPGFDIEALKITDPDPVFATVKISSGRGDQGSGPNYGPEILQSLADQFNTKRPPGYKGHQDPDKVSFEWREPVTAWVGANFVPRADGGADLYVKGYVPSTAPELRQQLALASAGADIVNSVSIFGTRKVDKDEVTDFDLWSLDWTPKGRAGMETELVLVSGEQAKETEEMDRSEIIRALQVSDLPESLVGEIRKGVTDELNTEIKPLVDAVGEMKLILELDSGADATALVEALRGLIESKNVTEVEELISDAVAEIESSDLVKSAVKDILSARITEKPSEEELAGEISKALEQPYIKALATGKAPVIQSGGGRNSDDQLVGAHWE